MSLLALILRCPLFGARHEQEVAALEEAHRTALQAADAARQTALAAANAAYDTSSQAVATALTAAVTAAQLERDASEGKGVRNLFS